MTDFSSDQYNNVIQQGIKGDIDCCIENERFRAALILIYSAIDSMAFLAMPAEQLEVTKKDFIDWADRYISIDHPAKLTSEELYAARCAMVHTYGVQSRATRASRARMIGYADQLPDGIRYTPSVSTELLIVSIEFLRNVVFAAIDNFMLTVHTNAEQLEIVENRLNWMIALTDLTKK